MGEHVIVVWDYAAVNDDELNLTPGETIIVTSKGDDGWWHGYKIGDKTVSGAFPYNYVREASEDELLDIVIANKEEAASVDVREGTMEGKSITNELLFDLIS